MTKAKLLEKQQWLDYCKTQTMIINMPEDMPEYQFQPIGVVVDLYTGKAFYFDSLVTVSEELGVRGQVSSWVYDSEPCLAPAQWHNGYTYLHPSRISKEDNKRLVELYRKDLVDFC